MKKSVFFVLGIILAGVGTAGYWALSSTIKPTAPLKKEAKKVSLLAINYVPTTPAKPVDEGKFWELTASPEMENQTAEKDLKDLKGKPVILHFWATWCAPCVQELPELDTFAQKYEQGIHIIAVATDVKDAGKIREFYKAKGIKNLSVIFDKNGTLSRYFRPTALPTTVFINSKGDEIGRIQGMVEWTGTAGRLLNVHLRKN